MIVTCVHVKVKPERIADFIRASEENHNESVKEEGNLRFDLIQQVDDPATFMLYEAYTSEELAAEHKSTPHYMKWRNAVEDMMAAPRKGIRYRILKPNEFTL